MKLYKISIHGPSDIIYEDDMIKINIGVADLRDPSWLVCSGKAYNKSEKTTFLINHNQKILLYRRVSYDLKQELYDEKTGFINSKDYNPLVEDDINLMEVKY